MTPRLPALGIDMAKSTFDVHVLVETKVSSQHFVNTSPGFEALAQWRKQARGGGGACLHGSHRDVRGCGFRSSCITPAIR